MSKNFYRLAGALLGVVYLRGLFIPLMDNDAAHHANIALHMFCTGDYVSLIDQGRDYLDKPHLHFWLAALSYHIFGVNSFAYKFPSLLFSILGIYATYRLGKLLYSKETGRLAAFILATSFSFILANHDVRMDAILTSSVIFSIWQLIAFTKTLRWKNLMLASIGLACGFSTKGMIGIVMPGIAVATHILYERNWTILYHWKWMLLPVFVLMLIGPVLYCYYLQFDLHPEKFVRGHAAISGVRFILWSQNIERLEGEKFGAVAQGDPFFFLHTFLWAFIPWSLLTIAAYWKRLKKFIRKRFRYSSQREFITFGTITIIFIIISASNFKLPHYLNILLPLFSILLAGYLTSTLRRRPQRDLFITQIIQAGLLLIGMIALTLWVFPLQNFLVIPLLLLPGILYFHFQQEATLQQRVVMLSICTALFCNTLLSFHFYPQLLTHQAGKTLAEDILQLPIDRNKLYYLQDYEHSNSLDFYSASLIADISVQKLSTIRQPVWICTGVNGKAELDRCHIPYTITRQVYNYRVSKPKGSFLDPDSRASQLKHFYVLAISR
jgi:4-amino-4-deoxy-L-arabinose transferase-like glycosyltransferase